MKNMIKGLDNDEIEFLNDVDNNKAEVESQKYREELIAIEEYKRQMAETNADDQERKLLDFKRELFRAHKHKNDNNTASNNNDKKKSQAALMQGAIKRKMPNGSTPEKKVKLEETETTTTSATSTAPKPKFDPAIPTQYCIGVLPGLGCYDDDSDSCDSDRESDESHDDLEHFQVFGTPVSNTKDKGSGGGKCKQ